MAMQINGNYDHSRTDYAERVKEKQEAERAEKAKEAGRETAEKVPVSHPNRRMSISAVKNRRGSLPGCIGSARTRTAIGRSILTIRIRPAVRVEGKSRKQTKVLPGKAETAKSRRQAEITRRNLRRNVSAIRMRLIGKSRN